MIPKPMINGLTVIVGLLLSLQSWAQGKPGQDMDWVDSALQRIRTDQSMDSRMKSKLADSAFQVSIRERDICKQVQSRIIQATHLDNMGMSDSALVQLYWANATYDHQCDSMTILMLLYLNLTNVYLSLGELSKVDSISNLALDLWNPLWTEKALRFGILNNLGIAQISRYDTISATHTFHQAYQEAEVAKDFQYTQISLNNLGGLKGVIGDLDSAYFFFNKAAVHAREYADMDNYMSLLINLANLDAEMGRFDKALILLDSAYVLADTLNDTAKLAKVQRARSDLFGEKKNYKKALDYLRDFIKIREQYLNEERVKAVTDMMEKYESEKKVRQIQQLEIEKLDATLETERIRNARNRMTFAGLGVLLMSIGLWSRLRYVRKSRAAIQKEKDISEGLLLNILPASVAEELKSKGFAEAKHYSTATILFSDFKSFTSVSEELNPVELVAEINICFKAFDEIMTKYRIEKIKTIGDAYMAAGGLPETTKGSPFEMVMAGIEMQRFIITRKKIRDAEQLPAFEMRIGIHSGSVVAGIVGVKKFQYDIWGDTVNIASRMESSGEPGRVNISDDTYQLVKDNPSLIFTPRGMVQAKGKGEMMMYFVDVA